MATELHTFTGNEVIATELPELLNQNFDYVRENSLKSVNGIAKDENNNVDVTFLTNQVIPTNSDLNNFRESGEYTRETDTIVVANSPTEKPFFLTVLASENLVKQVVTEIDRKDPMTFTRTLSGANWSPWVEGGVDIGIWKSEETVKVGDVRFLKGRENAGYVLECVKAGVTGESQPVLEGSVAEDEFNLNNFDGTLSIEKGGTGASTVEGALEKLGLDKKLGFPVGYMYWSVEPNVPAGRLPALGATYNRSLYADLWAWANNVGLVKSESEWQAIASANGGNCAYYSSGDGSTTFRVPSIKCWVKGANNVDEVGSYLEAGLPAFKGQIFGATEDGSNFSSSSPRKNIVSGSDGTAATGTKFYWNINKNWVEATNPVYGNSDTVQPPSIVGMWVIVAFGVAHNIGEADVANVMQAVEQVQTGLGKVDGISDYIIESYRNGTEWYEVYKSGKVRQGGTVQVSNSGSVITLAVRLANTNYQVFGTVTHDNSTCTVVVPRSNKTVNSFKAYSRNTSGSYSEYIDWECVGQGA